MLGSAGGQRPGLEHDVDRVDEADQCAAEQNRALVGHLVSDRPVPSSIHGWTCLLLVVWPMPDLLC